MNAPSQAPLLTVIVPVYNEAESLPALLEELLPYSRARGWRVLFVDDGSTDAGADILARLSDQADVQVLRHKVNRGYGGALKSGLAHVATPYAVTIDADGQHRVEDVQGMLDLALAHQADLVVGARPPGSGNFYRNLGKGLIRAFAGLLLPLSVRDLNSGCKLYRADLAKKYLPLCPDTMAFSDVITLIFIQKRHLVLEQPISIRPRRAGRSTISARTAFQTVMEILHIAMLFNPLRIFLPLAALCVTFGIAWGLPILLRGRGVSVGSMLAIVTGLLFFAIGLIADQLSATRMALLDLQSPAEE